MRNSRVAHRYSKALMDLAVETNKVEAVKLDVDAIRRVTTGELDLVMLSPVVKHEKKVQIFNAVFGGKIQPLTESFFNLVFTKGRELSIVDILNSFDELYRKLKGIEIVELTTAIPISEEVKKDITDRLLKFDRYKGKTIEIREKVDESIIGGFLIQMDDKLFDASIYHDLQVIKKQFVENMYVQKLR
jgi:F-type H+-transporting ATPase subunit delta